eukprot:279423_1
MIPQMFVMITSRVSLHQRVQPYNQRQHRLHSVRSYRAPEIILNEQRTETITAADVWSIGVIFAELLQLQKSNCENPHYTPQIFSQYTDELPTIFSVIGKPTECEIKKMSHQKTREYLRSLPNFEFYMNNVTDDKNSLDLLAQFLKFDAEKRISIDNALPYFEMTTQNEMGSIVDSQSFYSSVSDSLQTKQYRELILEEIIKYNKHEKHRFIDCGAMPNYAKKIET